jgi:Tfp pilus assembly protein PilV
MNIILKNIKAGEIQKIGNAGFTILETLVAVTILMIAVAGPLTIAHRGLLAAAYAAQQVTASYLAQDAIEYVKNVRDNNHQKLQTAPETDWLYGLRSCTEAVSGHCGIDTLNGDPSIPTGISLCGSSCELYTSPGGYTTVSTGNQKSPYSRYFYLTSPSGSIQKQAKLVVVVTWKSGTIENVFTFENEIFDVVR